MSRLYTPQSVKRGWAAKNAARRDSTAQDIFGNHGVSPATKPVYRRLPDFGKDLYFRRNGYDYTADDFFLDVNAFFQNVDCTSSEEKPTDGEAIEQSPQEKSQAAYTVFRKYFDDSDYFPPLPLLTAINTDKEAQNLITGGYNFAKSSPDEKLIYFGRELCYRGAPKEYTYENFVSDVSGLEFIPRKNKVNEATYTNFCGAFIGYEFFPTYEQIKNINKGNKRKKLLDLIRRGYEKAMEEPDKSSKFVGANASTRKRVPPREC